MDTSHDYLFKIILIGDSGVGKTSLMRRYTDNIYTEGGSSTIGVDFKIKTISVNNKKVKLQIWDTAGQERFKAIVSHYYRGANGIFLVFDILNKDSFEHLKNWMSEIEKRSVPNTTEIAILANKIDSKELSVISKDEIVTFLKIYGIPEKNFYEVSAQDNLNVENSFLNMTKILIEKNPINLAKHSSKVPFKSISEPKNSKCC